MNARILGLLIGVGLMMGGSLASAIGNCPGNGEVGTEGNSSLDMACTDFEIFATRAKIDTVETGFTSAGGTVGNVISPMGYGTMDSRTTIMGQLLALVNPPVLANAINGAAVKAKWRELFAINNPAYCLRLGVANCAAGTANFRRMAEAWLPINQGLLNGAIAARNAAQATWQGNQTAANATIYWSRVRDVAAYQAMVDATSDIIAGN